VEITAVGTGTTIVVGTHEGTFEAAITMIDGDPGTA